MTTVTEAGEHLRRVCTSVAASPDERLGEITAAAIRHLHAFDIVLDRA